MDLLGFAKDIGRQLFDTDAEATDNIRQHFEFRLSGVENHYVQFDRVNDAYKEYIPDPNKIFPGPKIEIPLY